MFFRGAIGGIWMKYFYYFYYILYRLSQITEFIITSLAFIQGLIRFRSRPLLGFFNAIVIMISRKAYRILQFDHNLDYF